MDKSSKLRNSCIHAASTSPLTGKTLCDILEEAAEKFPERDAFVFVNSTVTKQRVTFKKLHRDAISLAAGLVHLGLKPGQRVGIWAKNCYEWITCLYAMAFVKLVCVRIPIGYTADYLHYLVNKTRVAAIITAPGDQERILLDVAPEIFNATNEQNTTRRLPSLQTVILLDSQDKPGMLPYADVMTVGDDGDFERVAKLRKSVQPGDEIMILFTSGSTGLPKAVVRSHRCSAESAHTVGRHLSEIIRTETCLLSTCVFPHAAGELSTVMGVSHGFTVVVPDPSIGTEAMATLIREERVTVAVLMFTFLLDVLNCPRLHELDFSSIRYFITSGNMLPVDILQKARSSINPNIYDSLGSSETATTTLNDNPEKYGQVGYPVDHTELKVIDDEGHAVPIGSIGELCVRSPYTMLRYEDDEEQTKAVLDQSGWFHTGDLCQMDEDGCLAIKGRKKDVIIKGTLNIYPMEIDRVLIRHPKVKLSQTIGVPDELFVEEICSCVCLKDGEGATADEIVQFANRLLPELCVPKYVLFFDSFPASPTGKLMRKELESKAKEILGV